MLESASLHGAIAGVSAIATRTYLNKKLDKQVVKYVQSGKSALSDVATGNQVLPSLTLEEVSKRRLARAAKKREYKTQGRKNRAEKIIIEGQEKAWEEYFNSLSETERAQELLFRKEPKNIFKTVKDTGEKCRTARPTKSYNSKHIKKWPINKYHKIRKETGDIELISQNTGLPKWKIKRIKEHLFYNNHSIKEYSPHDHSIISERISRFDPDPEIATAWDRLCKGDYIKNDLDLLAHEYAEAKYESIFKTDYNTAHDRISNRWPWRYPKFGE